MAASTAPHLREDLLTPRYYTTQIAKAARTDLECQRPAFEAMLAEMEADYNRAHFDRKTPLHRLCRLSPTQKAAYESYLVRSCISEFSGVIRQTNRTARRAFPVVFVLDGSRYLQLRDQLLDANRQLKASAGQPLRQLGLRARFGWLLLRQFLQPMQASTEVRK